jgi:hypothetical protein
MMLEFFHLAGIIIALGAVTVIDTMGFISRKSKEWTKTTIKAHHVTKPLIWIGTILMAITWVFIYSGTYLDNIKSLLIFILILNGILLSFNISPRLDKLYNKNTLLPKKLQTHIAFSMIVSFIFWWGLVLITFL